MRLWWSSRERIVPRQLGPGRCLRALATIVVLFGPRHSDGGTLVVHLYGHPDRAVALDRIRRAYTGATVTALPDGAGRARARDARRR